MGLINHYLGFINIRHGQHLSGYDLKSHFPPDYLYCQLLFLPFVPSVYILLSFYLSSIMYTPLPLLNRGP